MALKQDGMLALARLQRKLRMVDSPYGTPQTLVGGPRADAALAATSGRTATTDPHPLHRYCLARRVRAKGGNALGAARKVRTSDRKTLRPPPLAGSLARKARYRVVVADGAALLDHLTRGIQANDSRGYGGCRTTLGCR